MTKRKQVSTKWVTMVVIMVQVLTSFSAAATAVIQPPALASILGQPSVAQAATAKPDIAVNRRNPVEAVSAAPAAAPLAAGGPASISGLVYNDYNANGTRDIAVGNAIDSGMGGLTVTAYDVTGTVISTASTFAVICLANNNPVGQGCTAANTPALGSYTLSNLPATTPVRVEFTALPTDYFPAPHGTNNATSVRFVTTTAGATANLDFGILKPGDYCQNNPMLCVPEMIAGDPANATTGAFSALKKWNYAAANGNVAPVNLANDRLVGTVWGLAYARQIDKLYSAAFLKRHAGLGPNGLGAIYVTNNPRTGVGVSTALFFDVATIAGVNVGAVPSNSTRGLTTPGGTALDTAIYDKVGKVGLGDIDISDDESILWTISLNDKKLIGISVNNPSAATAQVYTIPDPGCSAGSGDYRPFATKYYRGQLYLGVTCDASLSLQSNDLKAVVYRFDPANPGAGFVNILTAPLNYTKEVNLGCSNATTRWYPWVNSPYPAGFDPRCVTGGNKVLPQPLLSDIEFDLDGSLILGFIDRFAHQAGSGLALPDGTANGETIGRGEILRAWNNNGSFVLENNGAAGPVSGGVGNNQGPGGGEFYRGEFISAFPSVSETALGGLAFLPGSGEVVTTVWDPFTADSTHGVAFLSNTNGNAIRRHDLGTNLRFGKGAGLGDLEVLCDLAPIELGNRVWKDTNGNGIQDPGEPGIASVIVNLTTITGTVVAAATTDVNGNYYFSSATGATTGSAKYGLTIRPNTAYEIRIANATGASQQTALAGMTLTTANVQANTNHSITDVRDSDAAINSTAAVIPYTTGVAGATNHGLDFGFYSFGTVQIVKQTVGGDSTFTFSSANSTFNNLSLTTSAGIGSSTVFTKPIGSYVITENSQAG